MKRIMLAAALLTTLCAAAQDPRERVYNYEVLKPSHAVKPPVEGYAAERVVETFGRGLTARLSENGKGIYLSWRLLAGDAPEVGFDVYRRANGKSVRLTAQPVTRTTDFVDTHPVAGAAEYRVVPVAPTTMVPSPNRGGGEKPMAFLRSENGGGASEWIAADLRLLRKAPRYTSFRTEGEVGKLGIGDLDGDGQLDFVVRTPATGVDPGVQGRHYDSVYTIAAYKRDGTRLWSYSLGEGVEPGVWYSPYAVYDFDGDGRAEVALRICPDGTRDETHRVQNGHEYLLVLEGATGREIARVPWPERSWRLGDRNRQDRHQIGMAYLDGRTPAILAIRGTYRAMIVDAWELHEGQLRRLWRWDGDEENPVIRSQGAHNTVVGDVDGDGRDEILLGSCMLDDNGTLLWSAGVGHPDKTYLTDILPERPGMEVLMGVEVFHTDGRGVCCVDAATGEQIWNIGHDTFHVGDAMVTDFDPENPGLECFASEDRKGGSELRYLLTADGRSLTNDAEQIPPCRNWIWWDGDLLRETLRGTDLIKWPGTVVTEGIEGSVQMIVDLEGDWREEIITAVGDEIRIYSTCIPANDRRVMLLQDPVYRSYILERSQGYPQSPVPSYWLGEGGGAAAGK